jgi:hypothetical protein
MAVTVRATATGVESDGTIAVTKPTGTVDGDVLVAFCFGYANALADVTAPAGFTLRDSESDAANTRYGKVFTKVAASEGASYTFGSTSAFDYFAVILVAVQGADTTTNDGVDGTATSGFVFGLDLTADCPSVSPTGSDSLLLCAAMSNSSTAAARTSSWPGGMTELADFQRPDQYDTYTAASETLSASGATGTRVATFSSGGTNGWVTFSVAIKSGGAPPPTPVSYVANALGGTGTTTSFSITLPTTAADDIIVLEYTHRGTGDATLGGTYSGPAFTEKHDQQYATSTFSAKTCWSRATGNHSGQTVTGSGLTNSCAAIVTVYRAALASGDPLVDATIVGEQNASGDATNAQITTASDGAMVVLVVANSPDLAISAQACTSPGALTERAEVLSTGGTDTSISHASAVKSTAGATGAFTWTQTAAANGSWAYAIKPQSAAGTSATATPGAIALTTALHAVTPQAGAVPTPAVIATPVALPTASAGGSTPATATPAVLPLAAALPSATTAAGGGRAPAVIPLAATLPAATTAAGSSRTPAAIPLTAALPAATPAVSATRAPSAITLALSLPTVTVTAAAVTLPAAITTAFVAPAPSPSGGGSATATPTATALTVGMAAATTAAGAAPTPGAVVLAVTVPAATTAAGAVATPAVIPLVVTIPAATAAGSSVGTATPATITTTVTLPAPTPLYGSTTTPNPVTLAVTLPAPTVQGGGGRTPAVIPLAVTLPAATASGSTASVATPNAIALVTAVPNPTNIHGYIVNPATIALAVTIAAALATGTPTDVNPATITVRDQYHTVTAQVVNHVTIRDGDHTATAREQH